MTGIQTLSRRLAAGETSSRELVEQCLARIDDADGEGARAFLKVHRDAALGRADAIDAARGAGHGVPPWAGIPISIKDLFDYAGDVTTAGSRLLADAAPAQLTAPAIVRLEDAGFIVIGRTNMTEFAFSGLGLNPHYGTPASPYDRAGQRIPGGSSSGAAVSVSDGMSFGGIGTDTGGSCRIPAALCGITGFKPTARRVPLKGAIPLSPSLDSVGPLAASVRCCAILDAVMAGEDPAALTDGPPLSGLRFGVPQTLVLDQIHPDVARDFEAALSRLSQAGARISDLALEPLGRIPAINAKGGLAAAEGYAWHRRYIEGGKPEAYDPRVLSRLLRGREQSAADYIDTLAARRDLIEDAGRAWEHCDALLMPTVPLPAPPMADLTEEAEYTRVNLLMLRNPAVANMLDGCSISIPMHRPGQAPTGLMAIAPSGRDARLFTMAQAIESAVRFNG